MCPGIKAGIVAVDHQIMIGFSLQLGYVPVIILGEHSITQSTRAARRAHHLAHHEAACATWANHCIDPANH